MQIPTKILNSFPLLFYTLLLHRCWLHLRNWFIEWAEWIQSGMALCFLSYHTVLFGFLFLDSIFFQSQPQLPIQLKDSDLCCYSGWRYSYRTQKGMGFGLFLCILCSPILPYLLCSWHPQGQWCRRVDLEKGDKDWCDWCCYNLAIDSRCYNKCSNSGSLSPFPPSNGLMHTLALIHLCQTP